MTTHAFRTLVRTHYPHVKVTVKTVSFQDLARSDAKCLTVSGDKTRVELAQINRWAKEAGVLPDTSLRFRSAVPVDGEPTAQP